ncbi:MAG: hypothetical protein UH241_06615 [Acutalibacteraceae bacterium]|nr:hypothetical protein [Acutalibacteraceae bacterium]
MILNEISIEAVSLVVTSFISLMSLILTWRIFTRESNKTYLKLRYEKVIFPIFSTLEKHLYKKEITQEIINALDECKHIIEENKMIVGGDLLYIIYIPYNTDNFQYLSKLVEKEYDYCCSALGIPLRPLDYKFSCFRTRNLRVFALVVAKISIPAIIFFASMLYFMFFIISLSNAT